MTEAIENGWDEAHRWNNVEARVTAVRIGNPVSVPEVLPGIHKTDGTTVTIPDEEITAAQRDLAVEGVSAEPASAVSVTGFRRLHAEGVADADEQVVCLTTGHLLKDPDAVSETGDDPEPVPNDTETVLRHLAE